MIHRGDIYYVNADGKGHEQQGYRPCIIVSNDKNNRYSDIVEVVFLTSAKWAKLPTHATVKTAKRRSIALCEQITAVDTQRLKQCIGRISQNEMRKIEESMKISLGLERRNKKCKN